MAHPLDKYKYSPEASSGTPTTSTSTVPPLGGSTSYTTCAYCGVYFSIGTPHTCRITAPTPYISDSIIRGEFENIQRRFDEVNGRIDALNEFTSNLGDRITDLTTTLQELLLAMKGLKR